MDNNSIPRTTKLIKSKVTDSQGHDIGEIEDIILDLENGSVAYAVLSFGNLLGNEETYFPIPWGAIKFDSENHEIFLDIDKKFLEKAPGFNKNKWPDLSDYKWGLQIYTYFDAKPHWL